MRNRAVLTDPSRSGLIVNGRKAEKEEEEGYDEVDEEMEMDETLEGNGEKRGQE